MEWIKAITTDGNVEFFNVAHIISIRPRKCGDVVILMGAGLYWHVKPETMVYIDSAELFGEVMNNG